MKLNLLQSAIIKELKEHGAKLHGYKILSRINNRGLKWNHQQVYRDLNKMEKEGILDVESEYVEGKPDRKLYTLRPDAKYTFDEKKMTISFLIAYPNRDILRRFITDLRNELSDNLVKIRELKLIEKNSGTKRTIAIAQLEYKNLQLNVDIETIKKILG